MYLDKKKSGVSQIRVNSKNLKHFQSTSYLVKGGGRRQRVEQDAAQHRDQGDPGQLEEPGRGDAPEDPQGRDGQAGRWRRARRDPGGAGQAAGHLA